MNKAQLVAIIEKAAREEATELVLRGQGITELPAEIGQLTNLQTLHLTINWARFPRKSAI